MPFEDLSIDVKIALRQMRLRPGFTAIIVLTLAFGIGITTSVFVALYKTVLHPISFRDPSSLVAVHNRFPGLNLPRLGTSPFDYLDLRGQKEVFSDVGLFYYLDLNRTGVEQPEKVNAIAITPSLFRVLDEQPVIGRTFTVDEQQPGSPRAVVIRESYWQQEFARTPDILKRSIYLNGEKYDIVGVMPDSFAFPNEVTQMWTPLQLNPRELADPAQAGYYLQMYGRLASGMDFGQAEKRIADLSKQWAAGAATGFPRARKNWELFLLPMERDDDGSLRRWMTILFASVSSLLLIVCLNVAGLLLMRSYERRSTVAVRVALGATHLRIIRQLLTEVLILSAIGGTAGIALARLCTLLLTKYGPVGTLHLSGAAIWFGVGLTLMTSLVCGVLPGWSAARNGSALAAQATAVQRVSRRVDWQKPIIITQLAVATILMVSGGLLIGSLQKLLDTDLGFDARNLTTLQISLPPARYTEPANRTAFWRTLLQDVAAIPGVLGVSATTTLPFGYGGNVNTFEIVGRPKPQVNPFAEMSNVHPRYFETMRIPLVRGRYLDERDSDGSLPVVTVDRSFTARFLPGEDPIGRQIKVPWGTFTVAGVVESIKSSALDINSGPTIYFPAVPLTDLSVVIRTAPGAGSIVKSVRNAVTRLDKDQPIYDVFPMEALVDRSLKLRRFVMWLMSVFASAGTILAALGLYGLVAYRIATQKREIGIRKAIGAHDRSIAWLVCRSGLGIVLTGIAIGAAGALAAHRYIESQLYGVGFADPTVWLIVIAVLVFAGAVACAVPASRAVRILPIDALRAD